MFLVSQYRSYRSHSFAGYIEPVPVTPALYNLQSYVMVPALYNLQSYVNDMIYTDLLRT